MQKKCYDKFNNHQKRRIRMNQKEKFQSKEKGVTLTILVITVALIFILAGATASMMIGENSVIDQAKQSRQQQEVAAITMEINTMKDIWNLDKQVDASLTEDTFWTRLVSAGIMENVNQKTQTAPHVYTVHTTNGYDITGITLP